MRRAMEVCCEAVDAAARLLGGTALARHTSVLNPFTVLLSDGTVWEPPSLMPSATLLSSHGSPGADRDAGGGVVAGREPGHLLVAHGFPPAVFALSIAALRRDSVRLRDKLASMVARVLDVGACAWVAAALSCHSGCRAAPLAGGNGGANVSAAPVPRASEQARTPASDRGSHGSVHAPELAEAVAAVLAAASGLTAALSPRSLLPRQNGQDGGAGGACALPFFRRNVTDLQAALVDMMEVLDTASAQAASLFRAAGSMSAATATPGASSTRHPRGTQPSVPLAHERYGGTGAAGAAWCTSWHQQWQPRVTSAVSAVARISEALRNPPADAVAAAAAAAAAAEAERHKRATARAQERSRRLEAAAAPVAPEGGHDAGREFVGVAAGGGRDPPSDAAAAAAQFTEVFTVAVDPQCSLGTPESDAIVGGSGGCDGESGAGLAAVDAMATSALLGELRNRLHALGESGSGDGVRHRHVVLGDDTHADPHLSAADAAADQRVAMLQELGDVLACRRA